MDISVLKEAFIVPIENTIKQQEAATLGQFSSETDLLKQLGMMTAYKNTIKHFNTVCERFEASFQPPSENVELATDVEIIPPQK